MWLVTIEAVEGEVDRVDVLEHAGDVLDVKVGVVEVRVGHVGVMCEGVFGVLGGKEKKGSKLAVPPRLEIKACGICQNNVTFAGAYLRPFSFSFLFFAPQQLFTAHHSIAARQTSTTPTMSSNTLATHGNERTMNLNSVIFQNIIDSPYLKTIAYGDLPLLHFVMTILLLPSDIYLLALLFPT